MSSPRAAIAQRFAFTPEDRKTQAIIPDLSVRENVALRLAIRDGVGAGGLSARKQKKLAIGGSRRWGSRPAMRRRRSRTCRAETSRR